MIRTLLLSTLALTATALPLSAQTPTGPVQSAAQGAVKGTATVGQALFRVPDRQATASLRDLPYGEGRRSSHSRSGKGRWNDGGKDRRGAWCIDG